MKTTLLPLLASLALVGCVEKDVYVEEVEPTMPIAETGRVLNWSKLEAVPGPIRNAFLRQYPDAGITNVQAINAVTGRLVYQINYIDEEGFPGQAMYYMDGTRIPQPDLAPEPETAPPASPGGAPELQQTEGEG